MTAEQGQASIHQQVAEAIDRAHVELCPDEDDSANMKAALEAIHQARDLTTTDAWTQCDALRAAAECIRAAWDALCRCTDEFLPEYPEACSEHQNVLDGAVSALVDVLELVPRGDGAGG